MLSEKPVARSYVMVDFNRTYTLEYYLITETVESGGSVYGLMISQSGCCEADKDSCLISSDRERVEKMIDCYARNFVFPCSLQDLIIDASHDSEDVFNENRAAGR